MDEVNICDKHRICKYYDKRSYTCNFQYNKTYCGKYKKYKEYFFYIALIFLISFVSAGFEYDNPTLPKLNIAGGTLDLEDVNQSLNGSYWTVGQNQNVSSGTKTGSFILDSTGTAEFGTTTIGSLNKDTGSGIFASVHGATAGIIGQLAVNTGSGVYGGNFVDSKLNQVILTNNDTAITITGNCKQTGNYTLIGNLNVTGNTTTRNLCLNNTPCTLGFANSGYIRWSGGSGLSEQTAGSGGQERMLYTPNGGWFDILTETGSEYISSFRGSTAGTLPNTIHLYVAGLSRFVMNTTTLLINYTSSIRGNLTVSENINVSNKLSVNSGDMVLVNTSGGNTRLIINTNGTGSQNGDIAIYSNGIQKAYLQYSEGSDLALFGSTPKLQLRSEDSFKFTTYTNDWVDKLVVTDHRINITNDLEVYNNTIIRQNLTVFRDTYLMNDTYVNKSVIIFSNLTVYAKGNRTIYVPNMTQIDGTTACSDGDAVYWSKGGLYCYAVAK